MSVRIWINEHPRVALYAGATVLAACLAVILIEWSGGGRPPLPNLPNKAFYTTDDGATLFADSLSQIPPIDHNGAEAVRAHVYTCNGGRSQWVQYLEKYSDADQKILRGKEAPAHAPEALVKKPGDTKWVSMADPMGLAITNPKCPDGMGSGEPRPVAP